MYTLPIFYFGTLYGFISTKNVINFLFFSFFRPNAGNTVVVTILIRYYDF